MESAHIARPVSEIEFEEWFGEVLTAARRFKLTDHQARICQLVARGCPSKEIAARLEISCDTVDKSIVNIMAKVGAKNRVHLSVVFTLFYLWHSETTRPRPLSRGARGGKYVAI